MVSFVNSQTPQQWENQQAFNNNNLHTAQAAVQIIVGNNCNKDATVDLCKNCLKKL
jgi:hypothetical protein